jgi:hypothetical protein
MILHIFLLLLIHIDVIFRVINNLILQRIKFPIVNPLFNDRNFDPKLLEGLAELD